MKTTTESILTSEKQSLLEAIDHGNIELNNEFLDRYCGDKIKSLLLKVDYTDRAYLLSDCIDEKTAYFIYNVSFVSHNEIYLNINEIETQFEGPAEEFFEAPDDFYIDGLFAYLSCGYGLAIPVDIDRLALNIVEHVNK